jgi:[glutamine synthetase] adenylyltransferase / [glutamine synthetase]-adenylyl-L-tyrosine phosphorylase
MGCANWIEKRAAASLYPTQVESALVRLNENWPVSGAWPLVELIENFPLGDAALLHLLACSSVSAARLARHPEMLLWLSEPEICGRGRGYPEMLAALHTTSGDKVEQDNFRALRHWKNCEMARIALRELANAAALEETTAELSQVAEISVRTVFEHWNRHLRESLGSPTADFAILALGKLGGHELNHSSDVDLIFLYSEEGELSSRLSYHQWFNRLGEKIVATFSTPDPAGALFRVDLRLRPEGSAGPLARSLESMENYYAGFGETWERLALIKARGICGSRELVYEFLRQHQPFIYPRSPTPDLLDEIANIKRRIEEDVVGADNLERDVKLGRGGIREIEFVVQTLQFIYGGRHAFLQGPSTLKALNALARLELIPRKEVLDLDRAYRFLRQVEHRLQIEAEQQTHTLPRDSAALQILARSLGFGSASEFTSDLAKTMEKVRSIFARVISTTPAEAVLPDLSVFKDEKSALRSLTDLVKATPASHIAPRTRQIFKKLRPFLIEWFGKVADPDATLNQFVRFVEAYGLRGLLFELLATNPTLLELLMKTLDASRFAGDLLIRRPTLVEEITRDKSFNQPRSIAEHLERLKSFGSGPDNLDPVRAYRQRQLLRIIMRDVLGVASAPVIFSELSDLAEACLLFTSDLIGGRDLTIVALGKFGGRELNYGADLDVLFIGDDSRAAQTLCVAMAQPSSEGNIASLDARLRPDGEKGPLVISLAAYEAYYRERAQTWEIQAQTRARPIVGPFGGSYLDMVQAIWRNVGQQPDLFVKIDDMLERIRRERGTGSDFHNFKTGAGGMVEAEFLVQALQMRAGIWGPNWNDALRKLRDREILSSADTAKADRSYQLLRACETTLRRFENKGVSTLPIDTEEQQKLARRLGFKSRETFTKGYEAARETIHSLYEKHIRKRIG